MAAFLPAVAAISCGDDDDDSGGPEDAGQPHSPDSVPFTWAYQLTGYEQTGLDPLFDNPYTYLVIDAEKAEGELFAAGDLQRLHAFPGRKILSYLSIGEAEDYRDYWPQWSAEQRAAIVVAENPEWPGNYAVAYWNEDWQALMAERARTIIAAGFDGLYLDKIDVFNDLVYEYGAQTGYGEEDLPDLMDQMQQFVSVIAAAAREANPHALVFPQNAVELLDRDDYRALLDGLGKEDTFYYDNGKKDAAETAVELRYLRKVVADGKPVIAVDYCSAALQEEFFQAALAEGFVPYRPPNRDLDSLTPYEELWSAEGSNSK